jgi:hypothetical protein
MNLNDLKSLSTVSLSSPLNELDKQLSKFNQDQLEDENRTHMFLAKVNAHITNNLLLGVQSQQNKSSIFSNLSLNEFSLSNSKTNGNSINENSNQIKVSNSIGKKHGE